MERDDLGEPRSAPSPEHPPLIVSCSPSVLLAVGSDCVRTYVCTEPYPVLNCCRPGVGAWLGGRLLLGCGKAPGGARPVFCFGVADFCTVRLTSTPAPFGHVYIVCASVSMLLAQCHFLSPILHYPGSTHTYHPPRCPQFCTIQGPRIPTTHLGQLQVLDGLFCSAFRIVIRKKHPPPPPLKRRSLRNIRWPSSELKTTVGTGLEVLQCSRTVIKTSMATGEWRTHGEIQ